MTCQARKIQNEKLDLKYFDKYIQLNDIESQLEHRRNDYRTRLEYLQKRQEALHNREIQFKEKILSYEVYIKELAMKYDRSLRRIDDEKQILHSKQSEIECLNSEIEKKHEEKLELENLISHYQSHFDLLTQIVDQNDRFQSIDELIEKFDMLHASYENILLTVKNSNEELNNLQRKLLLTVEKKNAKISSLNNRIQDLEQTYQQIRQRTEKIQTEIRSYQQISIKHMTEIGAMKIAVESMFDLVKKYSHSSRKKNLNSNEDNLLNKLKQIDIFFSDLVYYVEYVNNKPKKTLPIEKSIHINEKPIVEENNQWRIKCDIDQGEQVFRDNKPAYTSYKIRGEDNRMYTIQIAPLKSSQSLLTKQSSISMIYSDKVKKKISSGHMQKSLETRSSVRFSKSDLTS